jgi:hypothetical protein
MQLKVELSLREGKRLKSVQFENIRGQTCCESVRPSRFYEGLHQTILAKQVYYAMRSTSAFDQTRSRGARSWNDCFRANKPLR